MHMSPLSLLIMSTELLAHLHICRLINQNNIFIAKIELMSLVINFQIYCFTNKKEEEENSKACHVNCNPCIIPDLNLG